MVVNVRIPPHTPPSGPLSHFRLRVAPQAPDLIVHCEYEILSLDHLSLLDGKDCHTTVLQAIAIPVGEVHLPMGRRGIISDQIEHIGDADIVDSKLQLRHLS